MSMDSTTQTDSNGEETLKSSVQITHSEIRDRLEGLVALGRPSCTTCYSLSPEDRPDHGAFWPDPVAVYVNADASALCDWIVKRACGVHDDAPDAATHRVLAAVTDAPESRYRTGRRYDVQQIDTLDTDTTTTNEDGDD